jgi:HicB family
MSRLTLRLPESLHERLAREASREGVSLNHYIVYSLTRAVTATDLEIQRRAFDDMTRRYPAEDAEVALRDVLADRS